ncbi:hypothetical protein HDE_12724 [Halotydeus destructor]|nr:hypothetical protein HDE_12724 [Halotydeus destructor]
MVYEFHLDLCEEQPQMFPSRMLDVCHDVQEASGDPMHRLWSLYWKMTTSAGRYPKEVALGRQDTIKIESMQLAECLQLLQKHAKKEDILKDLSAVTSMIFVANRYSEPSGGASIPVELKDARSWFAALKDVEIVVDGDVFISLRTANELHNLASESNIALRFRGLGNVVQNIPESKQVIKVLGRYVAALGMYINFKLLVEFFAQHMSYLTHLEEIRFESDGDRSLPFMADFANLMQSVPRSLQKIALQDISSEKIEPIIDILSKPYLDLTSLEISELYCDTDQFSLLLACVERLRNLNELKLCYMKNLFPALSSSVRGLINSEIGSGLENLSLQSISPLEIEVLEDVIQICSKLKILKLDLVEDMENEAETRCERLKTMKYLHHASVKFTKRAGNTLQVTYCNRKISYEDSYWHT